MNLEVARKEILSDRTIGNFYINGVWFAYTMEDTDRIIETTGFKIPRKTAIPRGTYQVIIDHSEHFKRDMPHLLNVPFFEGVRIHAGNRPEDTDGCILIGKSYDPKAHIITESSACFEQFFGLLQEALKTEKVSINIE